jgi:hypothetical protein
MSLLLEDDDLFTVVNSDPPQATESNKDKLREWGEKSRKAFIKISLCVSDDQLLHIEDLTTGKEAWDALKTKHETASLSNKLLFLRQFFQTEMENTDLAEHIYSVQQASRRLNRIGCAIQEEMLIAVILSSLPSEYEPLIMAFDAVGSDLTLEDVKLKLITQSQKFGSKSKTFAAYSNNEKHSGQKDPEKSKLICSHCKKTGHTIDQCFKLKPKTKRNNPQQKRQKEQKQYGLFAGLGEDTNRLAGNITWILDSGASQHIVNDNKLFSSYAKSSVE